jgi:hypothetical protein
MPFPRGTGFLSEREAAASTDPAIPGLGQDVVASLIAGASAICR